MAVVISMAAHPGQRYLTERLAARALRLALDPSLVGTNKAAELASLAGGSPRHLARARRRLRCHDTERRSRIVTQAEQLLVDAQSAINGVA